LKGLRELLPGFYSHPISVTMSGDTQHILLTGLPGCGKTTVVQRVIQRLAGVRLAGFYTREMRESGRRIGFQAVGLHGEAALLAHVKSHSPARVGKYGVDVDEFERLVTAELSLPAEHVDLFVIDEIGKMECLSQKFVDKVMRILRGDIPLLATIALKGGEFIGEVKRRPNVELLTATRANREELPADVARRFLH
jgi:nucleoside-triphosphatase